MKENKEPPLGNMLLKILRHPGLERLIVSEQNQDPQKALVHFLLQPMNSLKFLQVSVVNSYTGKRIPEVEMLSHGSIGSTRCNVPVQ